ncbi:hypothetical protein PV08_02524 [Exophiala spinifera]|uniref:Major facilitator superfamily (MFS) profile domain-containing protein n=1 Tax=Exophiala spinifera TaxID=91928 RepID=A0A0D1YSJ7_9EURO|nr:uncharacterized protein PV08_02524 [Exophiala spinifera]KIW18236.1 hypothetical protein PV08_02524 [Exophiala spinifera]
MPQPSADPNDPLNWSRGRKYWHMFVILFWCFIVNAAIAWTGTAWAVWVVDLDTTYVDLNNGQGLLVFMCAFGCLFFQPYALKYGRRVPYIVASAFVLVGVGVGLTMTDTGLFFAYMVLSGFGSGPAYSTNETSIVDIMFLHQRGTWLGIYCLVLLLGNFLPPVAAGYIVEAQGWQWCFKYLLIFMGVATILLVFGAEETLYVREEEGETSPSETSAQHHQHPHDNGISTDHANATYLQRMTLFRRDTRIKLSYMALVFNPFRLMLFPAVVWASLMLSLATFMTSIVVTTQAGFFSAPPYNFGANALGLMYFAIIIGMVFGAILGGPLSDWIVAHLARRNDGVMEPEYRLWAYLPVPFTAATGILLYGVGASYGIHWVVPCIGLALIGFAMNAGAPISMAYAFDCYNELSGETVQLTNFVRNAVGGAITFVIQPWINQNGARNTSIIIAILVLVLNLSSVVFQIWGKTIRALTARRYKSLVEKAVYF